MKLVIWFVFLPFVSVFGQEQFGAAFSNYTPTNSVFLNPSSMLDAKTWLDIHIVGAGVYANNNLVSLDNTNFTRIIRTQGENITEDDISYHQNKKKYAVYNRNFVSVLSGVWSQGDNAAGLFFNVRSYTALRGVPDFAARFIENGIPPYTQQHNIDYSLKNVYASSVNYGEIQLSYARTFVKRHRNMWMGGISLKKFISIAGGAANIYGMDFNVRSDTLLSVFRIETDAMYTAQQEVNFKGGLGLDLGFTYQKMLSECSNYYPNSKLSGCTKIPYKYKIGVSIMDIGAIKFKEESTQFVGYNFTNYDWYGYANQEVNEDSVLSVFQNQESTIDDGRVSKKYKIQLPTYISIQGDYNLWASRFFANASIVQGLPISRSKFGVRRANSLMVGLRFETKIFDVSLPLSLYEYKTPQLGFAFRIYCLTLGTDKLLHFMGNSDLYGGDIYAHLKIPIFYSPKCRSSNSRGSSGRNSYSYGRAGKFGGRRKNHCDAYN